MNTQKSQWEEFQQAVDKLVQLSKQFGFQAVVVAARPEGVDLHVFIRSALDVGIMSPMRVAAAVAECDSDQLHAVWDLLFCDEAADNKLIQLANAMKNYGHKPLQRLIAAMLLYRAEWADEFSWPIELTYAQLCEHVKTTDNYELARQLQIPPDDIDPGELLRRIAELARHNDDGFDGITATLENERN